MVSHSCQDVQWLHITAPRSAGLPGPSFAHVDIAHAPASDCILKTLVRIVEFGRGQGQGASHYISNTSVRISQSVRYNVLGCRAKNS